MTEVKKLTIDYSIRRFEELNELNPNLLSSNELTEIKNLYIFLLKYKLQLKLQLKISETDTDPLFLTNLIKFTDRVYNISLYSIWQNNEPINGLTIHRNREFNKKVVADFKTYLNESTNV